MDDKARLQLQKMIKANNVEDQTELIRELKHSHGKIFVKPAHVKFVSSPHRYHHFDVIWTQPTDGLFFHFNNFRYSDSSRGINEQLKNLLPKLLERI